MDDDTREGVVVLEVEQRTPAARLGVRRGDIVVAVNDEKVTSVEAAGDGAGRPAAAAGGCRSSAAGRVYNLAIQG